MPEPRGSGLSRLLERPHARQRIGWAVAGLMGTGLVALSAVGALTIWHLSRRARLIRERLGPPRIVRLPDLDRALKPGPTGPPPMGTDPR